ncbi:hypothetical protein RHMOL_Rhmol12G0038500 [Rhododendron molle]|uniref:Uncharacterized protein n=1 Tax=Rhododendron molle TaxID=49168 RepID=A0ACC0LE45_RHOML|nr:hypothetical protein RHMOL_Rhmol12G0038500 [Rhododendron molle]
MAEFEPPSFSLGLDFDLDSEPQTIVPKDPPFPKQPSSNPSFRLIEDNDDFEIPDPPQTLKRLRRGPLSESSFAEAVVAQKWELVEMGCNNIDDEIEEFSSQEDRHRGAVNVLSYLPVDRFRAMGGSGLKDGIRGLGGADAGCDNQRVVLKSSLGEVNAVTTLLVDGRGIRSPRKVQLHGVLLVTMKKSRMKEEEKFLQARCSWRRLSPFGGVGCLWKFARIAWFWCKVFRRLIRFQELRSEQPCSC